MLNLRSKVEVPYGPFCNYCYTTMNRLSGVGHKFGFSALQVKTKDSQMFSRAIATCICLFVSLLVCGQSTSQMVAVSIAQDDDFSGYDLLNEPNKRLFVLGEHWHNIQAVPEANLKLLQYLHRSHGVRVLAIEQGTSAALMVNQYLENGDTTLLRDIARYTMYWAREHWTFFEQLRAFNLKLPAGERIRVHSVDIEYKMEPAVYIINQWLKDKVIPDSLSRTLGEFVRIFEETREHRESYQNLLVHFYYPKDYMAQLVANTLADLQVRPEAYEQVLADRFEDFQEMITDMQHGLLFDYTNPLTNYKYRDTLIEGKFLELADEYPSEGILCVIGMRHMEKRSSIYKLNERSGSPWENQVVKIRLSALYNGGFFSGDLRRLNFSYPNQLKDQDATLIQHTSTDAPLRSKKGFDYTLFLNRNGQLKPFKKVYRGEN